MDRIDNSSTDTPRYSKVVGIENDVAIGSLFGAHSSTGCALQRINIEGAEF
jgi:hypothetical protein